MNTGIAILLVFLALQPLAALLRRRGSRRGLAEFVVAGRGMKPGIVAASLLATILGGSAVMGTAGLAARHGWWALCWLGSGAAGLWTLSLLIHRIDMRDTLSLPHMARRHGGPVLRIGIAAVIVPAWIGIVAAQLAAFGKVAEGLSPGAGPALTALAAVVIIAYVAIAGQKGVIRTDGLQLAFVVLLLGGLLVTLAYAPAADGISAPATPLPPLSALDMIIAVGVPFLIGPDMFSRLLALPDAPARRRSLRMASTGLAAVAVIIVLIGIGSHGFIDNPGEDLLVRLPGVLWGPAGAWIAACGLGAALLSSADTCLLSAATIGSIDLFGLTSLRSLRLMTVGMGVSALGIALWQKGIISTLLFSYTVYTGGLAVPATLALFFHKRLPAGTMVAAMIAGAAVALGMKLSGLPLGLPASLAVSGSIAATGLRTRTQRRKTT